MANIDSFDALRRHGKYATAISQPIASRAILRRPVPVLHDSPGPKTRILAANEPATALDAQNQLEALPLFRRL